MEENTSNWALTISGVKFYDREVQGTSIPNIPSIPRRRFPKEETVELKLKGKWWVEGKVRGGSFFWMGRQHSYLTRT